LLGNDLLSNSRAIYPVGQSQSFTEEEKTLARPPEEELSMNQALLNRTREICERYKIHFAQLTVIQRKFVTHYRCEQCGLLPLYKLDLLHMKRVRCRNCGGLVAFKNKGKYGRLRKEIAVELIKGSQRYVIPQ
jgi:DNA-directed RNA polymerase subunit RPC12/RpoP